MTVFLNVFRRSPRARSVLVAASMAVASALPLSAQGAADAQRPTLAVLYFTNGALIDNASFAPLSKGMAEMLITELAQNSTVRVVERDRLQSLIEEQNPANSGRVAQDNAVKMAQTLGARHTLTGTPVHDPTTTRRTTRPQRPTHTPA